MRANRYKRFVVLLASMLCVAAFVFEFWPLAVLGIITAGFGGASFVALILGIVIDLMYGSPGGWFSYLLFPFTIVACITIGGRVAGTKYLFERTTQGTRRL
jgi:hypothetical protein